MPPLLPPISQPASSRGQAARHLLPVLLCGLAVTLCGCRSHGTGGSVNGAASGAAVLVEWQFPMEETSGLPVNPLQRQFIADPSRAALRPALHPGMSEKSEHETEYARTRLIRHATRVANSYIAGRENFTPPFLANVSTATPETLRELIGQGVRIVSFSIGSRGSEDFVGIEDLVREHPEVLFLVSTPHISGNSIGVEALGELPSMLAARGHANILLVGAIDFYDENIERHRAGHPIGSPGNPFFINNQPAPTGARQVFMLTPASINTFCEAAGGTSTAAPCLAALLGLVADKLQARGRIVDAATLIAELDRLTHKAMVREKTDEVREASYFTLDTLLLNAGHPLATAATWRELAPEAPAPRHID